MRGRDRAGTILREHMDILRSLADLLLKKETVTGRELDDLIRTIRPGTVFPA